MDDVHEEYDTDLYATIDNARAKTIHVMDPFSGFMFGSAFDEEGNLRQQQFEKHEKRVRLIHAEDDIALDGIGD